MTAIEFFDRTPIENIISAITTLPDKIIFIGDGRVMSKWESVYKSFLQRRGLKTTLEFKNIRGRSIEEIVELLSEIVCSEDPCIFEVTGGSEPALVAMGIVFDRYRDRDIQMQYFKIRSGSVIDCDNDGAIVLEDIPELDVREIVGLHGGIAKFETYGMENGTVTEAFSKDVEAMWEVCRRDPRLWNFHAGVIASMVNMSKSSALSVSVPRGNLRNHLKGDTGREDELESLLISLSDSGVLKDLIIDSERIAFKFKSSQVKKCLIKAGTVLEVLVLMRALQLKDHKGNPYYNDGLSGVRIDWDGAVGKSTPHDTENEIDVMLTRGVCPVFISCKNGHIDDGELYKLDAVANRFGGEYAKRVLICTYAGRSGKNMAYIKQRAKDMKIQLIENVHKMTPLQLKSVLKGLC